MKGNWNGKLLDSRGRQGALDVTTKEENETSATVKIEIAERDTKPLIINGEGTLSKKEESLHLSVSFELENQGSVSLEADLSMHDAGLFADSALMGIYAVSSSESKFPLSNGVIILWQFK